MSILYGRVSSFISFFLLIGGDCASDAVLLGVFFLAVLVHVFALLAHVVVVMLFLALFDFSFFNSN